MDIEDIIRKNKNKRFTGFTRESFIYRINLSKTFCVSVTES